MIFIAHSLQRVIEALSLILQKHYILCVHIQPVGPKSNWKESCQLWILFWQTAEATSGAVFASVAALRCTRALDCQRTESSGRKCDLVEHLSTLTWLLALMVKHWGTTGANLPALWEQRHPGQMVKSPSHSPWQFSPSAFVGSSSVSPLSCIYISPVLPLINLKKKKKSSTSF